MVAEEEEEEEKLDEIEEKPSVQMQKPPPRPTDDSGWTSATTVRKRRETRWYDNLPQVSSSGKSDACDSIASGRGEHTTDHLPELIDAVGEGSFDRGILARIIAQAFLKNEVVAVNALISRHYLLTEIPHALLEGGTKQLVSPIIVIYNTLVDPRRKSFGTCYSITWQKANRYRTASTV
ncbi:MAG: hypothetical protein IPK83_10305 [Planctomycetes bacterium]|nr:hypothetical protein [Planctomycetota bacterium]